MTIKETDNLQIIKKLLSEHFDTLDITDIELYDIVSKKCLVDLIDLDLSEYQEQEQEIVAWVEENQDLKQAVKKLETLFLYIDNQGYDLETLLNTVDYNKSNFDISILSEQEIDLIIAEIEYYVSELDYIKEKTALTTKLEAIEIDKTNKHIELSNKLRQEIEDLKLENKQKELKFSLDQLRIAQAKEFLSTKELAIVFPNMSVEKQKTYRGRIHDPLPYEQLNKKCKIVYERKKIDIWRKNNF